MQKICRSSFSLFQTQKEVFMQFLLKWENETKHCLITSVTKNYSNILKIYHTYIYYQNYSKQKSKIKSTEPCIRRTFLKKIHLEYLEKFHTLEILSIFSGALVLAAVRFIHGKIKLFSRQICNIWLWNCYFKLTHTRTS